MADALELKGEEGRDKLRKAGGEKHIFRDPRMSEWSNPVCEGISLQRLNKIGRQGETV